MFKDERLNGQLIGCVALGLVDFQASFRAKNAITPTKAAWVNLWDMVLFWYLGRWEEKVGRNAFDLKGKGWAG